MALDLGRRSGGASSGSCPDPGDVVLVGHEIRTGATHEALRLGRIAGATTILNPAPAGGLAADLDLADILTPNRGELAVLAGADGEPGKLGEGGCSGRRRAIGPSSSAWAPRGRCSSAGGTTAIPARPSSAVDTVGAGDALNGALAAGLAAGQDLEAAARRAVVAAACRSRRRAPGRGCRPRRS